MTTFLGWKAPGGEKGWKITPTGIPSQQSLISNIFINIHYQELLKKVHDLHLKPSDYWPIVIKDVIHEYWWMRVALHIYFCEYPSRVISIEGKSIWWCYQPIRWYYSTYLVIELRGNLLKAFNLSFSKV